MKLSQVLDTAEKIASRNGHNDVWAVRNALEKFSLRPGQQWVATRGFKIDIDGIVEPGDLTHLETFVSDCLKQRRLKKEEQLLLLVI